MPWKETGPVLVRTRFIELYLSGFYTITELAARLGVSRRTLHKFLSRHDVEGATRKAVTRPILIAGSALIVAVLLLYISPPGAFGRGAARAYGYKPTLESLTNPNRAAHRLEYA